MTENGKYCALLIGKTKLIKNFEIITRKRNTTFSSVVYFDVNEHFVLLVNLFFFDVK